VGGTKRKFGKGWTRKERESLWRYVARERRGYEGVQMVFPSKKSRETDRAGGFVPGRRKGEKTHTWRDQQCLCKKTTEIKGRKKVRGERKRCALNEDKRGKETHVPEVSFEKWESR